jgi:hypothetical protein
MKTIFYLFCLLCGGLFSGNLFAATVEGLYEAEVPVEDQGAEQRESGLKLALKQVVIKVSGQYRIADDVLEALLPQSARLAQQFRYRSNPEWEAFLPPEPASAEMSDEGVESPALPVTPVEPPPRYLLWVQFDEAQVNQALHISGLPMWGKVRPAVLVWLMVESLSEPRYLVAGEEAHQWQKLINQTAEERGLPVWLPLMDLEDQTKVSYSDIWGNFQEPIMAASRRYMADVVVVARLVEQGEAQWQSRWTVYEKGEARAWYSDELSLQAAISRGMHALVDLLAERYAQLLDFSQQGRVVVMQVSGVNGLADYARLMSYIVSLGNVKQVMVKQLTGDQMTLTLELLGPVAGLRRIIGFGHVLLPQEQASIEDAGGVLSYQLQP